MQLSHTNVLKFTGNDKKIPVNYKHKIQKGKKIIFSREGFCPYTDIDKNVTRLTKQKDTPFT